jgi:hypothetical protein
VVEVARRFIRVGPRTRLLPVQVEDVAGRVMAPDLREGSRAGPLQKVDVGVGGPRALHDLVDVVDLEAEVVRAGLPSGSMRAEADPDVAV